MNEAQELYNHLLSATRQVIERAFGLLFGRFRRLKFLDMNKAENIPKTIIACCVLHNLCLSENHYEDFIKEGMPVVRDNRTTESDDNYGNASNVDGQQRRGEIAARLYRQRIGLKVR